MKPAPIPKNIKTDVTQGMSYEEHISYQVTFVSNLMEFGSCAKNVKQFGINVREWQVLALLGQMGPLTAKQLVTKIRQDKANISRAIAALEKKEYILKLPNEAHKRSPYIWQTTSGKRLYESILPIFISQATMFTSALSDAEKKVLCHLLDKLKINTEKLRKEQGLD